MRTWWKDRDFEGRVASLEDKMRAMEANLARLTPVVGQATAE
jgi:hypothetical protein